MLSYFFVDNGCDYGLSAPCLTFLMHIFIIKIYFCYNHGLLCEKNVSLCHVKIIKIC